MSDTEKSKDELLQELIQLRNVNESLKEQINFRFDSEILQFNERFDMLMKAADFAWWELNISTGNVSFSDLKAEILGYEPAKFKTYKDFTALIHPEDYEKTMQEMVNHLKGLSEKYDIIYRIKTSSGDYKTFHDIGKITQRDSEGKPLIVSGIVVDVFNKLRFKEAQKEYEKRFSLMIQDHKSIMLLIDPVSMEIVDANKSASEFYMYSIDELKKMSMHQINALNPEKLAEAKKSALKGEKNQFYFPHKRSNGEIRYVESFSSPIEINNRILLFSIINDITERKRTEEELNSYFNNALDLFCIADSDGKFIRLNKEWEKTLGYTLEELEGKQFISFVHPDDVKKTLDTLEYLNNKNELLNFTNRYRSKDNTYRIIEWRSIPNDNLIYAAARDITERQKAEEALRESEEKYRNIVDNSMVGVFRSNINGEILYINNAIIKILGYDNIEEMKSNSSVILYKYPSQREEILELIKHKGKVENFEATILTRQGTEKIILLSVVLNGNILDGTFIDITERKLNEELLQSQEEFLTVLTDNLPGMKAYWTKEMICTFANSAYLEWFGKSKKEMIGISMFELMGEALFNRNKPYIDRVLAGERVDFERTLVKANGEIGYTWAHYIPDFNNGDLQGFFVLVSDITELKETQLKLEKLNQELAELNAAKDKFFSIIAHDLKNPLANFRDVTKLLAETYSEFSEEERIDFLNLMKDSSQNIYSLLENLLVWSTSQRGVIPFHPTEINLKLMTIEIVKLFKPSAEKKNIIIENHIPASLMLKADLNMLNTIIRNLISNAIKFTPIGGKIELGVLINTSSDSASNNYFEIFIKDSGTGMSKSIIDHLFKIGSSKSSRGTSGETGTGLGLILCKEFIEKNGGKIWVESEEGTGSTFYFTIPK